MWKKICELFCFVNVVFGFDILYDDIVGICCDDFECFLQVVYLIENDFVLIFECVDQLGIEIEEE